MYFPTVQTRGAEDEGDDRKFATLFLTHKPQQKLGKIKNTMVKKALKEFILQILSQLIFTIEN